MKLTRLIQVGAMVGATLNASLPVPESLKPWGYLVAAIAYAVALLTVSPKSPPTRNTIVVLLIVGAALGIVLFWIATTKTITVMGKQYIRGDLTPEARAKMDELKLTEAEYFRATGYKVDETWTAESIGKNTLIMILLYSLCILVLAFGLLGTVQYLEKSMFWRWVTVVAAIILLGIGIWLTHRYYARKTADRFEYVMISRIC